MEISSNDQSVSNDLDREERVLKFGYFAMLAERYPLNTEITECSTPESAFFLAIEREYMNIPSELSFESLKNSIPLQHRQRMQKIWDVVLEKQKTWKTVARVLKTKWEHAPNSTDTDANEMVSRAKMSIRDQVRKTVATMISKEEVPRNETEELSQLRLWQIEEKGLRKQFYDADKNYLVALRLYYEMLLEKPGENEEGAAVLPEDHPERWNIVLRNRYARLIDAAHQGISLAKAAHHEQIKKRMRKTREEPFIFHPLEVMMRFIRDIVPYVIEEKKLPMNFVVTTIVAAVHDLAEDTSLEIEDIIEFLRTRADRYDSSLDQVIESGFGRSREDIKRKQLDLLRPYVLDTVRLLLRLVTNDAPFTDKDNGYARSRNRLGSGRTLEILGKLKERTLQSPSKKTGTRTNRETPLRTIQEFPETNLVPPKDQRKADALLLRLETFARSSKQERRIALVVKIEDRTHNNSQLESSEPLYQRSSLRTTVARLAAYCVLDYDSSRAPLYNSLPRLIDETIVEYERFRSSYPDLVEDADVQYQDKLKEWQRIVPRFPPPSFLQKTMEEWESAHKS